MARLVSHLIWVFRGNDIVYSRCLHCCSIVRLRFSACEVILRILLQFFSRAAVLSLALIIAIFASTYFTIWIKVKTSIIATERYVLSAWQVDINLVIWLHTWVFTLSHTTSNCIIQCLFLCRWWNFRLLLLALSLDWGNRLLSCLSLGRFPRILSPNIGRWLRIHGRLLEGFNWHDIILLTWFRSAAVNWTLFHCALLLILYLWSRWSFLFDRWALFGDTATRPSFCFKLDCNPLPRWTSLVRRFALSALYRHLIGSSWLIFSFSHWARWHNISLFGHFFNRWCRFACFWSHSFLQLSFGLSNALICRSTSTVGRPFFSAFTP